MVTHSIRCPVLGAHVTEITDFEGAVARVICPEYDAADRTCRLKKSVARGGPLSQLLERAAEDTHSDNAACVLLRPF